MSKSAHELAEKVRRLDYDKCNETYNKEFGIVCARSENCRTCVNSLYDKIADRIEALEVPDMSRFVELPVDADGVPWHIGDVMECGDIVALMFLSEKGWAMLDIAGHIDPSYQQHYKPRTLDDIVNDISDAICDEDSDRIEALAREAYELGMKAAQS